MTDVADITLPDDPEAMLEFLNSDKASALQTPEQWADALKKYGEAAVNKDRELHERIEAASRDGLVTALEQMGEDPDEHQDLIVNKARAAASGKAVAPTPTPPAHLDPYARGQFGRIYNRKAPGAQADTLFSDSAEYCQAIWHANRDASLVAKRTQLEEIANAYTSTIGADGGFLIPEQMRAELLAASLMSSVVRPRARVLPMSTSRVPIPSIDETTRVGQVFGGVVAYWTEEQAAATVSSAKFGQIALEAKTLTAYTEIPNDTMQDVILFGAFFDTTFPQAMAHFEDLAFTTGTGVGEPLGFRSAGGMVTVAKETSQTADTVNWTNVTKMYARMFPQSIGNAVWVVSPDVFPQLAAMETSTGSGGLWIGPAQGPGAPPSTLLGRPVITSDKVPVVGDLGDINFVDFSYYLIGDRQTMTASNSPHYKFANRQTAFLLTERVDGRPWLESAITPPNGGNPLSAYVDLAERA